MSARISGGFITFHATFSTDFSFFPRLHESHGWMKMVVKSLVLFRQALACTCALRLRSQAAPAEEAALHPALRKARLGIGRRDGCRSR